MNNPRSRSTFFYTVFILLVMQGLLLAPRTTVWAQDLPDRSAAGREIHVEFTPGTVALPEGQTQATPQELAIEAPQLQETFKQFGVERVAKAFPEFEPVDTIATTRTGEQVRLADVSEVFTLRLPSESGIERAIARLNELPQVIFAERNGRAISQVTYPDDQFFDARGRRDPAGSSGTFSTPVRTEALQTPTSTRPRRGTSRPAAPILLSASLTVA